jgi:lipooligosaccharide transport system permease protein
MIETLRLSLQIVKRNWWVYRKDFIANISPTIADPAFVMISLGAGLGSYVQQVHGMSYAAYIAPGLAISTAMFTSFFETSYGFYVRMTYENVFKAMLTTPINAREIIIGEFLWVSAKCAVMASSVTIVLMLFGLFANPLNLIMIPFVGILIGLPLGAMGLLSTYYVKNINQFQTVYAFIISPLYFFSGIFFPISQMPEYLQWVAKSLPLYHGVVICQALYWDKDILNAWLVHGSVLVVYSALFILLASHRIRAKVS